MGEIHAILPDGRVLTNIDVFKRLYEAVGLGWVYKYVSVEIFDQLNRRQMSIFVSYQAHRSSLPCSLRVCNVW